MKIVIDARMYGLEHAGIGRYVINLIDQISRLDKQNNYFVLLRRKYFRSLKFKGLKFKKILADYPHYSLTEQFFLPLQLIKLQPDLVHFPHFNVPLLWPGKYVVTIHDLIKHGSRGPATTTHWQPLYWFKYWAYRLLVWRAIKKAAKIITPSHWWEKELIGRFNLPPAKIAVTYEGASKKFSIFNFQFSKKQEILKKYKIKKPFVIYTGSLYPHKNIKRLIEAIKFLKLSLVVVCARSVFFDRLRQEVKAADAERDVNLAGFIPDEELVVLYGQAEAFVFPSLIEGFGLPGLEAMAAGLPVVASNSSCLPEIYGEAAIYFDPHSVGDMADKIKKVICHQSIRNRLIKLGYKQVAKYSWQKMARETLEVYRESGAGI